MGGRFLRLTHYGRRTGRAHDTVLEVVHRDKGRDTYYVASAWGARSAWVGNISANPKVILTVGKRRMEATAERVLPTQAEEVMRAYGRRHPLALRLLARDPG